MQNCDAICVFKQAWHLHLAMQFSLFDAIGVFKQAWQLHSAVQFTLFDWLKD